MSADYPELKALPSICVCGAVMVEVEGKDGDINVRCPNFDCEVYGQEYVKVYAGARGGQSYVAIPDQIRHGMDYQRRLLRVEQDRCPACGELMYENDVLGGAIDCLNPDCVRYVGPQRVKVLIPGAHVPPFPENPANDQTSVTWLKPCWQPDGFEGDGHDWVMVALDEAGARSYCRRCRQVELVRA